MKKPVAPRLLGSLLAVCVIVGAIAFGANLFAPKPPLPPLLRNVSAGGGWWGSCPAETTDEARLREGQPLALSPELSQRLSQSFPPGSGAKRLVDTLQQQGFELLPSCKTDNSIRAAAFTQKQGGGLFSSPLTANVFWKVDGADNIVWTNGFVRYKGL
jgi:hypothetical protein